MHEHDARKTRSTASSVRSIDRNGPMPVPVDRHHSTSAGGISDIEKKPLARGASQTGSPGFKRSQPRAQRSLLDDDEVELVGRLVRGIHERVRPPDHGLEMALRRRQREARELSRDELDLRRLDV